MRRLITILAIGGALYYAWDYFVVKGNENPFRLPEPRPLRQHEGETEVTRQPGRGLNPFVTDSPVDAAPAGRPPMPSIPGSSSRGGR